LEGSFASKSLFLTFRKDIESLLELLLCPIGQRESGNLWFMLMRLLGMNDVIGDVVNVLSECNFF
jgi:hypothetical protein